MTRWVSRLSRSTELMADGRDGVSVALSESDAALVPGALMLLHDLSGGSDVRYWPKADDRDDSDDVCC
jgi:hypothetical protein